MWFAKGQTGTGKKIARLRLTLCPFGAFVFLNCFLLSFVFACLFWIESSSVAQASRKLTVYLRLALNSLQFSCLGLLNAGILDLSYHAQFTQSGNQTQGFLHAGWALCQQCQLYPRSSLFLPLNKRMQVPKHRRARGTWHLPLLFVNMVNQLHFNNRNLQSPLLPISKYSSRRKLIYLAGHSDAHQ